MKFDSKFDIGDKVYFWSIDKIKIRYGEITSISLFCSNNKVKWNYSVKAIDPKDCQPIVIFDEQVPEHLVFKERDAVFDFCMELTKDI